MSIKKLEYRNRKAESNLGVLRYVYIILLTFFIFTIVIFNSNFVIAAEPTFPGVNASKSNYKAYWTKYGEYLMENAPDDIKNGNNVEKSKYIMEKVGNKADSLGIQPNHTYWGRTKGIPKKGPMDRGACGDMTNTMEDALGGAGIADVETIVGNKTGIRGWNIFDVNRDHGTVGVFNEKGEICMLDLWQHGVDTGSFKNSGKSKWNCMDGDKWGKEMEKQNYKSFNKQSELKKTFKGSDKIFKKIEKDRKQEKERLETATKSYKKKLNDAEKAINNCKFTEAGSQMSTLIGSAKGVERNHPELVNQAKALLEKSKTLQTKLNNLKTANTKAETEITECKSGDAEATLKRFISDKALKACKNELKSVNDLQAKAKKLKEDQAKAKEKVTKAKEGIKACKFEGVKTSMDSILNDAALKKCGEYKEAEGLKTQAKTLEANKKKADDALAAAKKALESANKAVTDATNEKNKITELKTKAESALTNGRSKLEDLPDSVDKCAKIKEQAGELATALTIAESAGDEVGPYYQTTKDARKEACELADEADLALDKEELEALRDKAYSLSRQALEAKENAEEKAEEADSAATEAENKKGSIDTLLEEIGGGKSDVVEAKTELNKGLSPGDPAEASSGESDGTEALTIPSISGECYQDIITKAEKIKADAESKKAEAEKLNSEASTIRGELEQIQKDINQEIANLPGEDTFTCDTGQLADEKDARASADTAEVFAGQSSDNWAEAEKCASRLRQAVLEFEEEEPSDDIPEIFAEGEVVDDPGYLEGECSGRIMVSPTRGYQGEPLRVTITVDPEFDDDIVRVTTNNPGCTTCDAERTSPGVFERTLYYTGKIDFKIEFLAYDKDGNEICSGYTETLRALGPKR